MLMISADGMIESNLVSLGASRTSKAEPNGGKFLSSPTAKMSAIVR